MSSHSQKLTFPGSQGEALAARLDMPSGQPRAYALFAHCFTCSKDIFAASRISNELANRGFAVLRFDFTGLGASKGEFANTNFSSNVADLLQAVEYLRQHHAAPEILIGHSLGGAAVLSAALDVPEARAVATIGAPADAGHVAHLFNADIDEIQQKGVAQVTLAGRNFTIKKQFLDDLEKSIVEQRVADMDKALLIFHAPFDGTVGINNAAQIFQAARHPKSFISLDDADHLLSRREDAIYVAQVLSAWAARYISHRDARPSIEYPGKAGVVSVAETGRGKFQQEIVSERHRLIADEPREFGGLDSGPSPYDLLSAALGACTTMTMRIYAEHKGYDAERFRVDVSHRKTHAKDCAECGEGHEGRIDVFERIVEIKGAKDAEIRDKILAIADRCPVHKTLSKSSAIITRLKES